MAEWSPTAVCFDLDGCLVDSTRPITAAINSSLERLGLPRQDPTSLTWFIGPPLHESYVRLLAQLGEDPGRAGEAVAAYRDVYGELSLELTTAVDGIPGLLEDLAEDTCRLLVVTSKPRHFAEPILRTVGLRDHFEAVHGPDLDALQESKVDTLARALDTTGLTASDPTGIAMVGDRHHDVAAGRAHGCATIGVTWGAGTRDELERAGATAVVDTVADLGAVLGPARAGGAVSRPSA